ncbi:MAG: type VII secretion integral membrane protein EccD [Pseudonocardia sp.]|nr:type VII secretion integral membrane protein EccD [Pseudonocardia sp.]
MVPGRTFCRLTVLAPRTRVDVALPADVPVADLVPMLLELVGEPRADGLRPAPWRLSGAAGGSLPAEATLDELAVPDGEMLRLAPVSRPPPPPVFDDPVDALAASAADAPALGGRFGSGALLTVAVAAAGICAAAGPGSPASALVAGLAAVAALWGAGWLAARPPPAPAAARTAALLAVPVAGAAGWTALPAMAPNGLLTNLLLAVAAAGVAATVAQVVVRVVAPALITVVVAAVAGCCGLIGIRVGAGPQAAATAIAVFALACGPILPRAAIRLAGLPRPVSPDDPEPDDAGLSPAELTERATLARGYLGGLAGGCAVATAGGAVACATLDLSADGWVGATFAAAAVAALALRSRAYADTVPARATVICALTGGVGLAAALGVLGGAAVWTGLAMLVPCAVGVLVLGRATAPVSPVTRRVVDMVEGALVVAAIPLALGAMGLYAIVRGL